MQLKSQSLLVTGAARGIGEAIALGAARQGARVTAVDVDGASLRRLSQKAREESLQIESVEADVATREGNNLAIATAEFNNGPLNSFIANAAVIRFADLLSTTEEDWNAIHRVNLKGVHLGIQAAIPSLRRASGGSIVLIASVLGIVGDPQLPAYGAAKGGLRALCRSVAVAYGPDNIRCNTICPGDVETDMMRQQFALGPDPSAARAEVLSKYPLKRFAQPEDIANLAIFLASRESAYMTGTDLIIDGGLMARCY
jgi:NAD(P)-dependent dehydrogenase (short-subunit alcohol dehydrogenase family)